MKKNITIISFVMISLLFLQNYAIGAVVNSLLRTTETTVVSSEQLQQQNTVITGGDTISQRTLTAPEIFNQNFFTQTQSQTQAQITPSVDNRSALLRLSVGNMSGNLVETESSFSAQITMRTPGGQTIILYRGSLSGASGNLLAPIAEGQSGGNYQIYLEINGPGGFSTGDQLLATAYLDSLSGDGNSGTSGGGTLPTGTSGGSSSGSGGNSSSGGTSSGGATSTATSTTTTTTPPSSGGGSTGTTGTTGTTPPSGSATSTATSSVPTTTQTPPPNTPTPPPTTPSTGITLSPPTNLAALVLEPRAVKLSWDPPVDSAGVIGYRIYKNGAFVSLTSQLFYTDTGIIAGQTYFYKIASYDSAGHISTFSESIEVSAQSTPTNQSTSIAETQTSLPKPVQPVAQSFISGVVLNPSGQGLANMVVTIRNRQTGGSLAVLTDANGAFSATSLIAASYRVEVSASSETTAWIIPSAQELSLRAAEQKNLRFMFEESQKVITGTVAFTDGTLVSSARVAAYAPASGQWVDGAVDEQGSFHLAVGRGAWQVRVTTADPRVADFSLKQSVIEVNFSGSATTKEEKSITFKLTPIKAHISGTVITEDGRGVADAQVILDTISSQDLKINRTLPPTFQKTDTSGFFSFEVPAGSYFIRANVSPDSPFFNPAEKAVAIATGETQSFMLVARSKKTTAQAVVTGVTKLFDGSRVSGYVSAWSADGGFVQGYSNEGGYFSINLPVVGGASWHISASAQIANGLYESSDIAVDPNQNSIQSVEIVMAKNSNPLADATAVVLTNQQSGNRVVAQAKSGARVVLPANATPVSVDTFSIGLTPRIEAPRQAASLVVSSVYDISVKDKKGNAVRSFNRPIEITIPFDIKQLNHQKTNIADLIPSYFNEATNTWVKIDDYFINKQNSTVIARVNHLTRFAIVAPADSTPPTPPKNIRVTKSTNGVAINWQNPSRDFDHAKVYRSTKKGSLGALVLNNAVATTFTDRKLSLGTFTYYYTVRAVDVAGNESNNLDQTAIKITSSLTTSLFPRSLSVGISGNDVRLLQEILKREGDYKGSISGFFDTATNQAVISFQERYAKELLEPAGLKKGTGYVGIATRKKLIELSR